MANAKRDKQSMNSSLQETRCCYRCTHCQAPSSSLYRYLGGDDDDSKNKSPSSIKLTLCNDCGRTVDPYIEQELLLVTIDCILGRVEAYRHVLYNNHNIIMSSSRTLSPNLLLQWQEEQLLVMPYPLLIWMGLDLSVKLAAIEGATKEPITWSTVIAISTVSMVGLLMEWATILFLFFLLSDDDTSSSSSATAKYYPNKSDKNFRYQLFMALLLPGSFNLIILFVMIWENSQTVRVLGSLLIAYWQGIGLSVLGCKVHKHMLAALLIRLFWRVICNHLLLLNVPCSGSEITTIAWFQDMRLCLT
jgi:hypothetical protein